MRKSPVLLRRPLFSISMMKGLISRVRNEDSLASCTLPASRRNVGESCDRQMQVGHHAELCHPTVHCIVEPVFVRNDCAALRTPTRAPRVLKDIPVLVIADDRKRMATVADACFPTWNHPISAFGV